MALTKITADVIENGAITSDKLASGAVSAASLTGITTDNVSEGSTNVYYTDTRARSSVSVTGGNLSYDSGTGVIQLTTDTIRGAISVTDAGGDGSLAYSAGVITYTGPSAAETRAHFSGSTGISYNSSTGAFTTSAIPNASLSNSSITINSNSVDLGASVTLDTDDVGEGSTNLYYTDARVDSRLASGSVGNIVTTGYIAGPATFTIDPAAVGDNTGTVVIAGDLRVDGTTTTINSTTLTVDDKNILLGQGAALASDNNGAGITVDTANASITYDSTNDEWDFNKPINVTGTVTADGLTIDSGAANQVATFSSTDAGAFLYIQDNNALGYYHGSSGGSYVIRDTDNKNRINIANNGDISFYEDTGTTAKLFWDASAESLGIGTTSPADELHVNGSGDTAIRVTTSSTSLEPKLVFVDGSGDYATLEKVNRDIKIRAFNTDVAHFTNGGSVGIGTSSPGYALDISNTTSVKINLQGGTNQNGILFAAAGNDGVSSSQYYLGVGSDLTSGSDYGAILLDVTNNRSILFDDQSNSRLSFNNNTMYVTNGGKVGIKDSDPLSIFTVRTDNAGGRGGEISIVNKATPTVGSEVALNFGLGPSTYNLNLCDAQIKATLTNVNNATDITFSTYDGGNFNSRMLIKSDGLIKFDNYNGSAGHGRLEFGNSGEGYIQGIDVGNGGSGAYLKFGLNATNHIKFDYLGNTFFGNTTNNGFFNSSGNLLMEQAGGIFFKSASTYDTVYGVTNYSSEGYSGATQAYWHHLYSRGGTHFTINTDGGVNAVENTFDDFVVWQGTQDSGEPLFRVSNTGRVIAKQNYEIGNHKTNREEFGVNAINTIDEATSDINTTVTNTYENRSGVYWLNFNSKKFRAFVRPQWLQGRNWVLAAKFFAFNDMPSGSALWTNDASWNGGDFDLNNGHFSKYGKVWRYFSFNRLAMQMGNRIAPIMQFSSNQTLYGAFSGGKAANGGGVTASSTDPQMANSARYHNMTNYMGPNFTDLGGSEDVMQSYGLNKWANNGSNSTSANNYGSYSVNSVDKGFQFTVEDSHPNIGGNDSIGFAGAWIGCPLDEGGFTFGTANSNGNSDSGFGFGGGCGNSARTWTSGIAEWARGSEVANYLPGYIWLSID